jgi:hypothetical protein
MRPNRRTATVLGSLTLLPLLAAVVVPEGTLSRDDPYITEISPDGRWKLEACARPRWFAMPGSGSDAPAWIVLRDQTGAIRRVSGLAMLQLYGGAVSGNETEWKSDRVSRSIVFDMPIEAATGPVERWATDRWWRLRVLAGAVPDDDDYH